MINFDEDRHNGVDSQFLLFCCWHSCCWQLLCVFYNNHCGSLLQHAYVSLYRLEQFSDEVTYSSSGQ